MTDYVIFKKEHKRKLPANPEDYEIFPTEYPLIIKCKSKRWHLDRVFDFSGLAQIYENDLAKKIANSVCLFLLRFARSTALTRYQEYQKYINYCGSLVNSEFIKIRNFRNSESIEFLNRSLDQYILKIRSSDLELTSQAEVLNALYLLLEDLFESGMGIQVNRIRMPRNYHHSKKTKPSLLEQNSFPTTATNNNSFVNEINKRGYLVTEETLPFIMSLEQSVVDAKHESAVDFFQALLQENNDRLNALRKAAEDTFIIWKEAYLRRQEYILFAEEDVEARFNRFLEETSNFSLFWSLFPKTDTRIALANFLKICLLNFDGKVPSADTFPISSGLYNKLIKRLGGKYEVDAMLAPHKDCVAAAILLFLIDSGANVSTAIEMETNFEVATEDPNFVKVVSVKGRANYRTIESILPVADKSVTVTAVEALRFIRDAGADRRNLAPIKTNKLFIYTFFSDPSCAGMDFVANNTTYILRRFNLPECWTPSAIRMSVAIKTMWLEAGRISNVARKLGHKSESTITNGYALSYPIRGLLEHYIRQFQDLFQFATALNVEGAVESLGFHERDTKTLKQRVKNSGLGFLWLNEDSINKDGQPLDSNKKNELENTDCRILVVVDIENLSRIIATNRVLTNSMHQLESQVPSHWESRWAPLLALSQVAIEKVKRSEFAYRFPEANARADELISCGYNPLTVGAL